MDDLRDQFPKGMRVLAVDDDQTCLMILETLLRRCQYHGLFPLFELLLLLTLIVMSGIWEFWFCDLFLFASTLLFEVLNYRGFCYRWTWICQIEGVNLFGLSFDRSYNKFWGYKSSMYIYLSVYMGDYSQWSWLIFFHLKSIFYFMACQLFY